MCGRFTSASPPADYSTYFHAEQVAEPLDPSYNVAPTNDVYVVVEDGGVRRLDTFRWGLVPFWAKDLKVGSKMINARAETLAEKPAYKRAFAKRRCIIPADGFFEWQKLPSGKKQPMFIHRTDGEPMAFAGLWEVWRPKSEAGGEAAAAVAEGDDPVLRSCAIVTGRPNEVVAPIHDRMPVMLPPSAWAEWLDPANDDLETLGRLLVPAPARLLTAHPVSTRVNNVREKGPELIVEEPVEA